MKTVPINIHYSNEVEEMTRQEKKVEALKLKVKNLTDAARRARQELNEAKAKLKEDQ